MEPNRENKNNNPRIVNQLKEILKEFIKQCYNEFITVNFSHNYTGIFFQTTLPHGFQFYSCQKLTISTNDEYLFENGNRSVRKCILNKDAIVEFLKRSLIRTGETKQIFIYDFDFIIQKNRGCPHYKDGGVLTQIILRYFTTNSKCIFTLQSIDAHDTSNIIDRTYDKIIKDFQRGKNMFGMTRGKKSGMFIDSIQRLYPHEEIKLIKKNGVITIKFGKDEYIYNDRVGGFELYTPSVEEVEYSSIEEMPRQILITMYNDLLKEVNDEKEEFEQITEKIIEIIHDEIKNVKNSVDMIEKYMNTIKKYHLKNEVHDEDDSIIRELNNDQKLDYIIHLLHMSLSGSTDEDEDDVEIVCDGCETYLPKGWHQVDYAERWEDENEE